MPENLFEGPRELAPTASTGNNTHTALHVGADWSTLAAQFVVEAVGATPTVTWKVQGSLDGTRWYDWAYITDASDTLSTSTKTATGTGGQVIFLCNPSARRYQWVRLVTTSNTNVTYRGEIYQID